MKTQYDKQSEEIRYLKKQIKIRDQRITELEEQIMKMLKK